MILISAYTIGLNFTSGIYPSATTMGTLELFNVPYDIYLKFLLKILLIMLFAGMIILSLAPVIKLI